MIVDKDGIILFVNPAAITLFGRKPEELIGNAFGFPILVGEAAEIDIIRQAKERVLVEMHLVEIEWMEKPVYLASLRDITERRKMEEGLKNAEASKFESIGILAGGIAHDFNNILTIIIGQISLAKMYSDPGDKIFERLQDAEKASQRAKNLTQQLLTFARGGEPIKKITAIPKLLEDTTKFAMSGSNVGCKFSIPDGVCPVECDEGQISQVINNLIFNAKESMPQGGMIEVGAENRYREDKMYVMVSIRDYGYGIPNEHLKKIFDPYFTTKQKGSGMGLATAMSIIKKHNGYIEVKSMLGKGTTFFIFLPASEKEIVYEKEKRRAAINGYGKILLMDDEESLLEITGAILEEFGYQVQKTLNGQEAIEQYQKAMESAYPFDVVVL
ncbi:MAG: ATP-binding protein, partial [Candidatus Desantisbacteria bacterium]